MQFLETLTAVGGGLNGDIAITEVRHQLRISIRSRLRDPEVGGQCSRDGRESALDP